MLKETFQRYAGVQV